MPHRENAQAIEGVGSTSRSKKLHEMQEAAMVPNIPVLPMRPTDVIKPATPSTPPISLERPKLTAPHTPLSQTLSEFSFLHEIEKLKERINAMVETASERFDVLKRSIQKTSEENLQRLQEIAEKAAASDWWSILTKIATALFAAITFGLGCALLGSGSALAGGALIASGVLSIASFAYPEAEVWDAVAKQLAHDDEEKRKKIGLILPIACGIIISALSIYGGIQCLSLGSASLVNRIGAIVQIALGTFRGITTMGKGFADGAFLHSKAELEKTSSLLNLERRYVDIVTKWMEQLIEEMKHIDEKANLMARMVIQSNQAFIKG